MLPFGMMTMMMRMIRRDDMTTRTAAECRIQPRFKQEVNHTIFANEATTRIHLNQIGLGESATATAVTRFHLWTFTNNVVVCTQGLR